MKVPKGHKVSSLYGAMASFAAVMLLVVPAACSTQSEPTTMTAPTTTSSSPTMPVCTTPTTATYTITVTVDSEGNVTVNPMSLDVPYCTDAQITWTSGTKGFTISSLKQCKTGFSVTSTSVEDDNTGWDTAGDYPYQVSITNGQVTVSSPDCTAENKPIIHNR